MVTVTIASDATVTTQMEIDEKKRIPGDPEYISVVTRMDVILMYCLFFHVISSNSSNSEKIVINCLWFQVSKCFSVLYDDIIDEWIAQNYV